MECFKYFAKLVLFYVFESPADIDCLLFISDDNFYNFFSNFIV